MATSSDGQIFFLFFLIVGDVLSAAGALMAEFGDDFAATHPTGGESFDFDGVNTVLEKLKERAAQMVEDLCCGGAPGVCRLLAV